MQNLRTRERDRKIKSKLFHKVFEILTDKGKPSERVGRKATGLKAANAAHGGWVAEVR